MVAVTGCIIPDDDIDIKPQRTNAGTVRIVQALAIPRRANEACAAAALGVGACPVPPDTVPPGLVEVEGQSFCICRSGTDLNALGGFDIFVEDPDVDDEGNPRDVIFGTLLLDGDPDSDDPSQFVAYTNYLAPNEPAQLVPLGQGGYGQPIERPPTNLKSWALGVETSVDLCNNNNETAIEPLPGGGPHSVRLVVTDRPWYTPVRVDASGKPARDGDGDVIRRDVPARVGIPDLPGGASYATAEFVFRCVDEASDLGGTVCNCAEDNEG